MRIDAGQQLRIDQRMKLAPRMIQSMEILQMPQAALEERIDQELTNNPTLELREAGTDDESLRAEREQAERDNQEGERELVVADGDDKKSADDFERLSNISEEYGDSWEANTGESYDSYRRPVRNDGERDRKIDAMANTAARSESMFDQLVAQWRMVETTPREAELGQYIIGFLDADGYLRTDMQTLLQQAPDHATIAELEAVLEKLQQNLEPPGLGARNLRECLLLQIDARERSDRDADLYVERLLVEEYLKDIEANRLPRIAKATNLTLDEVKQGILGLRQFQPHPGRLLSDDAPRTITPDAAIEYDEDEDRYVATLTSGHTPPLSISNTYARLARDNGVDKRTRDFVNTNLRNARWLIDALQQRNMTLLRVINVVLEAQRDYFDHGPQALKPLPMTTVADQLGIHVATVSRAVHEKYLQTPRGILPLRMFFSGGTETESGDSMSWSAVQAKLQEVIDAEDKSEPLNDDQLVDELKKRGIDIARRTVAKYRKQLNIPPARQRREF
ncbi:RNA polymerase factor sigma-54 [Phycisphaerales bacterium AB-hyl4]|uniref:RNA polymerase factor sigma-54 n=1 Tax=Natronomicrosphaera hydrolytica TaxID=3242702 RepID=A0ABV4U371_9BACT